MYIVERASAFSPRVCSLTQCLSSSSCDTHSLTVPYRLTPLPAKLLPELTFLLVTVNIDLRADFSLHLINFLALTSNHKHLKSNEYRFLLDSDVHFKTNSCLYNISALKQKLIKKHCIVYIYMLH